MFNQQIEHISTEGQVRQYIAKLIRYAELFHGVRPLVDAENQLAGLSVDDEPVTEAERLRVVHTLIAAPEAEGGAGITPGHEDYVESLFPLRDPEFNRVKSSCVKLI